MWGTAGWAVAIFVTSMFITDKVLEHSRSFDPLFCKLYSSSPHKSTKWWENFEGVACVEDRRTVVKGDHLTYHKARKGP